MPLERQRVQAVFLEAANHLPEDRWPLENPADSNTINGWLRSLLGEEALPA